MAGWRNWKTQSTALYRLRGYPRDIRVDLLVLVQIQTEVFEPLSCHQILNVQRLVSNNVEPKLMGLGCVWKARESY